MKIHLKKTKNSNMEETWKGFTETKSKKHKNPEKKHAFSAEKVQKWSPLVTNFSETKQEQEQEEKG